MLCVIYIWECSIVWVVSRALSAVSQVWGRTRLKEWVMNNLLATFCLHFTRTFLIMVTWQFFLRACAFTSVASASCQLFDNCCSCSVQPLVVPTGRKMVFLAIKSATVRESARNRWKSLYSNRSKAVLVLSFLKTYHDIFCQSQYPKTSEILIGQPVSLVKLAHRKFTLVQNEWQVVLAFICCWRTHGDVVIQITVDMGHPTLPKTPV